MHSFWLGRVAWPVLGSALLISSCIADGNSTIDPVLGASGVWGDAGEQGEGLGGDGGETPAGGFAGVTDVTPGSGGTAGKAGKGGSGGSSHGGGEGGNAPKGGEGGAATGGTISGQAGDAASGGVANEGGAPPAGGQAQGGGGGDDGPTTTLCMRLPSFPTNSFNITQAYHAATIGDCRISWVTRLYIDVDETATFLNRLLAWNLDLWGCFLVPPENFGLLYEEVPLTSADAEALIDIYMEATIAELARYAEETGTPVELSQTEIEDMRAALDLLADRVIERETEDFTDSHCAAPFAETEAP